MVFLHQPSNSSLSALIIFIFFRTPSISVPIKAPLLEKILRINPLGTLTVMAAVLCYILGLQRGGITKPWNSPNVIGTLVGCVVLVIFPIFLDWIQRRTSHLPIPPPQRAHEMCRHNIHPHVWRCFLHSSLLPAILLPSHLWLQTQESGARLCPECESS